MIFKLILYYSIALIREKMWDFQSSVLKLLGYVLEEKNLEYVCCMTFASVLLYQIHVNSYRWLPGVLYDSIFYLCSRHAELHGPTWSSLLHMPFSLEN